MSDYKELYEEMVESYSICFKGLKNANATATRRLELLEKVRKFLDTIYAEDIISSGDLGEIYEKIGKELADA